MIKLILENNLKGLVLEILKGEGPVRIVASGVSMYPFIRKGDIMVLDPFIPEDNAETGEFRRPDRRMEFGVGDPVLTKNDSHRWLIHRVIKIEKEEQTGRIITKGDALSKADLPVRPDQVWGKITRVERGDSERKYDLGKPVRRGFDYLLALLSRMEMGLFSVCRALSPGFSEQRFFPVIRKIIKLPRWLLIKIFFP